MSGDELLDTAAAADYLGVSRGTITRLVRERKLKPAHRGAGRTSGMVFRRDALDATRAPEAAK